MWNRRECQPRRQKKKKKTALKKSWGNFIFCWNMSDRVFCFDFSRRRYHDSAERLTRIGGREWLRRKTPIERLFFFWERKGGGGERERENWFVASLFRSESRCRSNLLHELSWRRQSLCWAFKPTSYDPFPPDVDLVSQLHLFRFQYLPRETQVVS